MTLKHSVDTNFEQREGNFETAPELFYGSGNILRKLLQKKSAPAAGFKKNIIQFSIFSFIKSNFELLSIIKFSNQISHFSKNIAAEESFL